MMFPVMKKTDGYWVEGTWMPTKEIMVMWPDKEQRARLAMKYEPKEEPMIILSWFLLLMFGAVAFGIFGAVTWILHSMGLF